MLSQRHVKDPSHSVKSAGGKLHLDNAYTLHPMKSEWADYAALRAQCGNLLRNELTRNFSGNIWPQLSQLTGPLWTDPGLKNGISVHELIST